jgi:hypothetical protein
MFNHTSSYICTCMPFVWVAPLNAGEESEDRGRIREADLGPLFPLPHFLRLTPNLVIDQED